MNKFLYEQEELENSLTWVASFHLGEEELDDSFDEENVVEINIEADSFEDAVKYAQQYLRKMQIEEETAEQWANAQILAVELY